ncbi:autotransporter domain-containing protein [Bradyrhizobium diazoefficiens]|nr:autotransporter domain-containing protein [Bradyrhizobium diazoefficiens]MBR0703996.1 autotransporter domain-containing protein [Bradyrhizobium diazoefficiens]MBR0770611.1 autotransporter domain-containing protein [Bradyrhizobium diazoefficiens]
MLGRNWSAAQRSRLLRWGSTTALTLALMPSVLGGRAEAACTPPSPVSGAIVTCAGTTTDANGTTGYGTATDSGNTINISVGSSVIGTHIGIEQSMGTVNNAGSIRTDVTNGQIGIAALNGVDLNNASTGLVDARGANSVAISALAGTVNLENAGTIVAFGTDATAISAKTVNVTNSGSIFGDRFGINATDITVTNNSGGSIFVGGSNGFAIVATNNVLINNAGIISAPGTAETGISGNVVTIASNTGRIAGSRAAISAITSSTINNNAGGLIEATGPSGIAVFVVSGTATVTNAGEISAKVTNGAAIEADAVVVSANTGLISGGTRGILANTATISNGVGGTISALDANGKAIRATTATIANAGQISALATGGIGIDADTVNVTANTGLISGESYAIRSSIDAVVKNNAGGTIQGTSFGAVAASAGTNASVFNAGTIKGGVGGGIGVLSAGTVTVENAAGGLISAGQFAVRGIDVKVSNAGIMESTLGGAAIDAQSAYISNSGILRSVAGSAVQVFGDLTLSNSGTIQGAPTAPAVYASGQAKITNAGAISGRYGIQAFDGLNLTNAAGGVVSGSVHGVLSQGPLVVNNAGSISGAAGGAVGAATTATLFNSGIISGGTGISSGGAANITNSGTIIGTGGTAILLSNAADTLTLLPGSKINGAVDFGFGNDVVNVNLSPISSKVSSLTTVNLPTFINFEGTIKTNVSNGNFNGPSVVSGLTLATLDPTALAQTDRTLMDFTGGVSSLVQGRLSGGAGPAGSNMMAMAYAPETAQAGPFTKAPRSLWTDPAPITVWANSFGGQRIQDETASTLRATSTAWGGAIGIDRKVRPDWLVGAFLGGGQGGLSVDLNSQSVDTNYVFAGTYSRFEWASQFFDFTIQGGNADNRSRRLVLNNAAVGGLETARANYSGWYVSPEVAYGYRLNIGNGYVLTPTARLRYVAGRFDGYSETGSAQSLAIGGRTLQDFEERGEVDLSRVTAFAGGELKANIHGGVIALQRAGDTGINAVLLGQNLSFVTPGSRSTVGAVAGLGFDYRTGPNVSVFGAVEGVMMSDQSRTGTAKGGVRVAF